MDKKLTDDIGPENITDGIHVHSLGGTEGMNLEENDQISTMRSIAYCVSQS